MAVASVVTSSSPTSEKFPRRPDPMNRRVNLKKTKVFIILILFVFVFVIVISLVILSEKTQVFVILIYFGILYEKKISFLFFLLLFYQKNENIL